MGKLTAGGRTRTRDTSGRHDRIRLITAEMRRLTVSSSPSITNPETKHVQFCNSISHFEGEKHKPKETTTLVSLSTADDNPLAEVWELGFLDINKAADLGGLLPFVFKVDSEDLASRLMVLLESNWEKRSIFNRWCESVKVPIYKKGARYSCENHRELGW